MSSKHYKSQGYSHKEQYLSFNRFMVLLPILLTVGLLPLMVRMSVYDTGLQQFAWYYAHSEDFGDTFLIYRQWWFTSIFFYMFFIVLGKLIKEKKSIKRTIVCLPLGIYALLALISSIFSDYPRYSFGGIFEQFENVFVLMGYALIVYYVFLMLEGEKEVQLILYTLTASTMIVATIGVFQTFGIDLYTTEFGKSLIVPASINADISVTMSKGTAYMTLYNPNYVGVYVAVLFPMFAVLLLFSKNWVQRILYGTTILLLMVCLYGSGSKAAFLVILGELIILLLFLRRPILKFWWIVIPAATFIVLSFLTINNYKDNVYISRIISALQTEKNAGYDLQEMTTEANGIRIKYKNNVMTVAMSSYGESINIGVYDDSGESMASLLSEDGLTLVIEDSRFEGITVFPCYYDDYLSIGINIDGTLYYFTNQYDNTGEYYYWTDRGKADKMIMAETAVFTEYSSLFSKRGYIWSVTIPLLKDRIILGSGADSFIINFPQQDYLRLKQNGFSAQLMSKPHSLYLQVGVQTGVLSLIMMLAFFVIYLVSCVRLYINNRFESFYSQVGMAVMIAVVGFMVMGISNDSSVTVSPVFWTIAGLGVFLNSKCREIKTEEANITIEETKPKKKTGEAKIEEIKDRRDKR